MHDAKLSGLGWKAFDSDAWTSGIMSSSGSPELGVTQHQQSVLQSSAMRTEGPDMADARIEQHGNGARNLGFSSDRSIA